MILRADSLDFIFNTAQVKRSVSFVYSEAEVDGNYDRHGLDSVYLGTREEWTSKLAHQSPL